MSQQDYFIEFARELGALNGNIKSVLSRLEKGDERIAQHESRLSLIEGKMRVQVSSRGQNGDSNEPLKNWVIKALIRIIGWGTVIIGSLAGAGEMLKSIHIE